MESNDFAEMTMKQLGGLAKTLNEEKKYALILGTNP